MITYEEQMNLFRLIGTNLKKDLECYAFGGNAMMFYGYKEETKDIDLLFKDEGARKEFIRIIKVLGFSEASLFKIYSENQQREKYVPLMFKNGDTRFDLFVKKIFRTFLSPKMEEDLFAVHEFRNQFTLKVKVLRKEHLVLLKAVTSRDRDFEDITLIVKKEKLFDWQYFIDEVIWQWEQGNDWALLDAEKMMEDLKEYVFIEKKYIDMLYAVEKK